MEKFKREDFYPIKNRFKINEIIDLIKPFVLKNTVNLNFIVEDISSLKIKRKNSLIFSSIFLDSNNFNSDDICIITDVKENLSNNFNNIILVNQLSETYNHILNSLFYHDDENSYPDEFDYKNGSYISKFSDIDKSAVIGVNSVIGRGVKIGPGCIIKNNVVIKNSIIGSNVIISDNTSIGTTGFGFDFKKRGARFLNPQIGVVIIGDNCHIGSSCTIDRGKIDATIIGKNSMIDNLVHIAHNVHLGENACIAAQTGISGSVIIGSNSTIGGQVGFAGHINIGNNVIIAAKSGVTKNIKDNSIVAGFPAVDIKLWKRKIIKERKNGYK